MDPHFEPVAGLDPVHTVPDAVLRKAGAELVIELSDAQERRAELTFSPVQAVRIWTRDLWEPPSAAGNDGRHVCELVGSGWRRELAEELAQTHPTASFLEEARHFVVPAGDDVVEVLAWQLLWRVDDDRGAQPVDPPASSIPGMD